METNKQKELSREELELFEEKKIRLAIIVGRFFRPIFFVGLGIYGITLIPSDIGNIPFSSLTLNNILGLAVGIILPVLCLEGLLKGSDDDGYEDWGNIGYFSLIILFLLGLYFWGK